MDNVTYIYHEHKNECYSKCYVVSQADGGDTSWYGKCPECGVYNTIDSYVSWSYVYSCGYSETLFVMGMCKDCGEHIYPGIFQHSCTYATCGKTEATIESISFN